MSQRTIGRFSALVILTLVLAVAIPARADAAQRFGPAGLWGWLQSLWEEGIGIVVRQAPPAHQRPGPAPGMTTKNGSCNDPHGCPSTQTSGGTGGSGCDLSGCS
jgi:hypothetical protein